MYVPEWTKRYIDRNVRKYVYSVYSIYVSNHIRKPSQYADETAGLKENKK